MQMVISDTDIIAAILRDTDKGFRMLVAAYSQRIYWHIRRTVITHHDAEDGLQETFVRAFRSIENLRKDESLKSWLYRIATNEALRIVEKRERQHTSLEDAFNLQSDPFVNYADAEGIELKKAIQTLPRQQRLVFNLRYYDNLSYDEIAAILDTTVQSARANYHNAKERIIKYMQTIY